MPRLQKLSHVVINPAALRQIDINDMIGDAARDAYLLVVTPFIGFYTKIVEIAKKVAYTVA